MDRIENAKMLLQRVGKINLGFYPTPFSVWTAFRMNMKSIFMRSGKIFPA